MAIIILLIVISNNRDIQRLWAEGGGSTSERHNLAGFAKFHRTFEIDGDEL